MARVDNATAIRDRAYAIWEREGRPSGREHEHWAEAADEIERLVQVAVGRGADPLVEMREGGESAPDPTNGNEIERLRKALYEPAEFSRELFGEGSEVAISAGNDDSRSKKKRGRAFG